MGSDTIGGLRGSCLARNARQGAIIQRSRAKPVKRPLCSALRTRTSTPRREIYDGRYGMQGMSMLSTRLSDQPVAGGCLGRFVK